MGNYEALRKDMVDREALLCALGDHHICLQRREAAPTIHVIPNQRPALTAEGRDLARQRSVRLRSARFLVAVGRASWGPSPGRSSE